jgi:hypothetical protein
VTVDQCLPDNDYQNDKQRYNNNLLHVVGVV